MNGLGKGIYYYTHVRDTLVRSKDFKTFLFSVPMYHESKFPHAHIVVRQHLEGSVFELVPASPDALIAYQSISEVFKLNLRTQYKECPSLEDTTQNPLVESIACTRRLNS